MPPARAGGRRRPRVTAVVAALALLSHLLFPVHLMAAGAPSDSGLVPICTGKGIVWVQLDPDAPSQPQDLPGPQSFGQPCHFCAKHTNQVALPQGVGVVIKMWLASDIKSPSYSVAARLRLAEGPHAIRAPPA